MKLLRRQLPNGAVAVLCFVAALFACWHEAWSQTARTIKVVVAAPPGGASDSLARVMAEQIGRGHAVTMMVENRPGASTAIGTEAVARAAPDGNTLLIVTPSFVINSQLRKLNYDPLASFEPICNLVRSPQLIVVNSTSPYRTLGELLRAARTKPGDLTMAGAGPATGLHIAFEMLKRAAKFDMTFVPYPGDAAAVNALLGEHVTSVFAPYPGVAEQLKAGNLRALAAASHERAKALPDVPTFAEAGYDDVEADIWQGIVAPANTPKETIARLADWFTAALLVPEVKVKLVSLGLYPAGNCGADFAALLRKQYDDFGRAIREANIKAD
jgi:tripartite-type tricarboxylate transporter receptor subunit TctC